MAQTPEMNLPNPDPTVTPGPDWAGDVSACFDAIDSHDHSTGKGVPITPDGMNINADLPMNGNNLTTANSVGLSSLNAALTSLLQSLQCVGVDLYFVDGDGNAVRITQSGSVTGASGTITGLPSGTASASFAAGAFTFQSATNTPATMNVGPLVIGEQVASPNKVTLQSASSLAAAYTLTLPAAQGGANTVLTNNGSGTTAFSTIDSVISTSGLLSVQESNASSVSMSSGIAKTIASITLGAGTWLIFGNGAWSGTAITTFQVGISTTTNSLSGLTPGVNLYLGTAATGSSATYSGTIAGYKVTPVGSTTYYLVMLVNATASSAYGSISAVRVA